MWECMCVCFFIYFCVFLISTLVVISLFKGRLMLACLLVNAIVVTLVNPFLSSCYRNVFVVIGHNLPDLGNSLLSANPKKTPLLWILGFVFFLSPSQLHFTISLTFDVVTLCVTSPFTHLVYYYYSTGCVYVCMQDLFRLSLSFSVPCLCEL